MNNKYNVAMDPDITINKSNKLKLKNPANWLAKSILQHKPKKYDFFVASMEANNQLDTSYKFSSF